MQSNGKRAGTKILVTALTLAGGIVFYILFGNSVVWALMFTILYFEWRVIPKLNLAIPAIQVKKSYAPYIKEAIRK